MANCTCKEQRKEHKRHCDNCDLNLENGIWSCNCWVEEEGLDWDDYLHVGLIPED